MSDTDFRHYFGKYRGVVTDSADPDSLGRVKVSLSDFPGFADAWCMPCVPYAGNKMGWFVIPEVGANVWIEFEAGDLNRPIWAGCFWDKDTIPDTATPSRKVFKTKTCRVVLDDLDGKAGTLQVDATTREGETVTMKFDKTGVSITAKTAEIIMDMDNGITVKYPQSQAQLTSSQVKLSVGDSSSTTITAQDQTIKSGAVTVQATSDLTMSATGSATLKGSQCTVNGNVITLQGASINIG